MGDKTDTLWHYNFQHTAYIQISSDELLLIVNCDLDSIFSVPLKSLHSNLSVTISSDNSSAGLCPSPPLSMVVVSIHHRVDAAIEDGGQVK